MAKKKKKVAKAAKGGAAKIDLAQVDFEASMDELNEIVSELEDGQLGLSSSLERYEQGVQYLRHCFQLLESAEHKIALLTGVDADGNPLTEPFENDDVELTEKAKSRSKRRSTSASKQPKQDDDFGGLF